MCIYPTNKQIFQVIYIICISLTGWQPCVLLPFHQHWQPCVFTCKMRLWLVSLCLAVAVAVIMTHVDSAIVVGGGMGGLSLLGGLGSGSLAGLLPLGLGLSTIGTLAAAGLLGKLSALDMNITDF